MRVKAKALLERFGIFCTDLVLCIIFVTYYNNAYSATNIFVWQKKEGKKIIRKTIQTLGYSYVDLYISVKKNRFEAYLFMYEESGWHCTRGSVCILPCGADIEILF